MYLDVSKDCVFSSRVFYWSTARRSLGIEWICWQCSERSAKCRITWHDRPQNVNWLYVSEAWCNNGPICMSLIITQEFSWHHNMASNMPYSTHIAFVLFVHLMHLCTFWWCVMQWHKSVVKMCHFNCLLTRWLHYLSWFMWWTFVRFNEDLFLNSAEGTALMWAHKSNTYNKDSLGLTWGRFNCWSDKAHFEFVK